MDIFIKFIGKLFSVITAGDAEPERIQAVILSIVSITLDINSETMSKILLKIREVEAMEAEEEDSEVVS